MPSSFKKWSLPEDETLRSSLGEFYKNLRKDAEESALVVRGIDNRQAAKNLVVQAAFRMAEHYAGLQALVPSIKMPADPAQMAVCVVLLQSEVSELAGYHDLIATNAEGDGDFDLAQRRRERAEDLRALLQVRP